MDRVQHRLSFNEAFLHTPGGTLANSWWGCAANILGRCRGFLPEGGWGRGGRLLPYISHIGMCRPKGKGFCPGGILRISRHRDDRMGLKINPLPPQKKKKWAFNKTHKKSLDQKLTPKKSHGEFLSFKKSQERTTSLPVEL